MSRWLVELELRDAPIQEKHIFASAKAVPTSTSAHRRYIYTVAEVNTYPEPAGKILRLIPFTLGNELLSVIWGIGRGMNISYWMLAHLTEIQVSKLERDTRIARESSNLGEWLPNRTNGNVLLALDGGENLDIWRNAGAAHMAGFHLVALPSNSSSDRILAQVLHIPVAILKRYMH